MKSISLVMIVKNEEQFLQRCLDSVQHLVQELIIVDTGSTDRTKDIITENGISVFEYLWNDSFADARNYALSQATSDWNLVLDADEYLSQVDEIKLQAFLQDDSNVGSIKTINRYKETYGDAEAISYIARLLPKGVRYTGDIHEQPDLAYPRKHVELEIIHDGYYDRNKAERNIPLLIKALAADPEDAYLHFQIAKEYRGIKQHQLEYEHLQKSYQLADRKKRYYPNIVTNYLYAILATKQLQEGLQIIEENKQQLANFSDFHFVTGLYLLDLILSNPEQYIQLLPQIESSYKRCLAIGENSAIYDSVRGTGSFSAYHNLGAYYEVIGRVNDAIQCYKQAAECQYAPSVERLGQLM